MIRRINQLLNIVMGCSVGVFIGYGIYVYSHYRRYPDLYAVQSAPWYVGIALYGVVTLIVLAVCFIVKAIIHKGMKR